MPWYFWALVVYFAIDLGYVFAKLGDWVEITGIAVMALAVMRVLIVWALIAALHH